MEPGLTPTAAFTPNLHRFWAWLRRTSVTEGQASRDSFRRRRMFSWLHPGRRIKKGVCAISLGDDPDALAQELQDRFPKAQLIGGDRKFEQWMAKVVGLIEAPKMGLDLPLDVRGTVFQQRVWKTLREIPVGSTANYAEIAKLIGLPRGARAVASACASNTIAVAIPCHRVLRTDGSISGYRWGVKRKRALLDRELAALHGQAQTRARGQLRKESQR